MILFYDKSPVIADMEHTLQGLRSQDLALIARLQNSSGTTLDNLSSEERRTEAIAALERSITFAKAEPHPDGHTYHSRDPLTGVTQTSLAARLEVDGANNVLPELQAFGQGNPIVWLPTGVDAVLEHFKPKASFKLATPAKSDLSLPDQCKVALLSDWGADNEHARKLGDLTKSMGADFVIHLGDIYYSGSRAECETFLRNWPLLAADGSPEKGRSFALNGNHEMYSLGRYYFTTVLDGLGQGASYFTLSNEWWQIHGVDTAYLPFSISGEAMEAPSQPHKQGLLERLKSKVPLSASDLETDTSLRPQWDWLLEHIKLNPHKKHIFLSHNQPVSAHLPEYEASYRLREEFFKLQAETDMNAVFAWFFGHEHRCAIYDDTKNDFKARLIGNGSIPHHPQEEVTADKDETQASCTPFIEVNKASVDGGPVAMSTFALLTFDKGSCTVDYINEDGSKFYKREEW